MITSILLGAVVLVAAFLVCDWSGRTLSGHYQDRWEVGAALAVGGCLFAALGVTGSIRGEEAGWPEVVLAVAMAAGLVVGYYRGATSLAKRGRR